MGKYEKKGIYKKDGKIQQGRENTRMLGRHKKAGKIREQED